MFNFFRKKVTKSSQDTDEKTKGKNETKSFEVSRQVSQSRERYSSNENSNESQSGRDPKTTCTNDSNIITQSKKYPDIVCVNNNCESAASIDKAATLDSNGTYRWEPNGDCISLKEEIVRRNSKTSKEIVNLLLPEDSVRYKKDSYFSKAGVQSLLDKMGRKKQCKGEKKSNRSWSFGGNKMKYGSSGDADRRSSMNETNRTDLKFVCESNVFANLPDDSYMNGFVDDQKDCDKFYDCENNEDSMRFDSLISEIDNINTKFKQDFVDCDNRDKLSDDKVDDSSSNVANGRDILSNGGVNDGNSDFVGVQVELAGKTGESGGETRVELTSGYGKNANGIREGGRWYFGADEDQSAAKRDTTGFPIQSEEFTTISHPEDSGGADESNDVTIQSSKDGSKPQLQDDGEHKSTKIDIDSDDLSFHNHSILKDAVNAKKSVEQRFEATRGSESKYFVNEQDIRVDSETIKINDSIVKHEANDSECSNTDQMGTAESRQNVVRSDKRVKSDKSISSIDPGERMMSSYKEERLNKSDVLRDFVVVVDDDDDFRKRLDEKSVVKGSLNLELKNVRTNNECEVFVSCDAARTSIMDREILELDRNEIIPEKSPGAKKRVTFHNVIEFDDGDRIEEDPIEEDSFASFDEVENDSMLPVEVENYENPLSEEFIQTGIVEFEDDSLLEDVSIDYVKRAKSENEHTVVIRELEVENDENVGLEEELDSSESAEHVCSLQKTDERQSKERIVTIEIESSESVEVNVATKDEERIEQNSSEEGEDLSEDVEEEEEVEEEIEDEEVEEEIEEEEDVDDEEEEEEKGDNEEKNSSVDVDKCDKDVQDDIIVKSGCEKYIDKEIRLTTNTKLIQTWLSYKYDDKEEESAYAELLRVLEKQMRGLVGQDERLADLQERAAALHRVQNEVCNARKEAELIRQKLWHVEADLAATRCRNSQLLEQLELKTEDAKTAELKVDELTKKVAYLQELLDKLIPESEQLKERYKILKAERDEERRIIEDTLVQADQERQAREDWWHSEFEKLRSQGAEREELLLADCEWKLREVQAAAREKTAAAEQRLRDLQRQADERCARADSQLAEVAELHTLQAEVSSLRAAGREQARALRAANERALHAANAETEAARLRTLLDREKNAFSAARAQYTKELEEKETRLLERLQEQATRLEREWKQKHEIEEQERRVKEQQENCKMHENIIKDAYDRLEILKSNLAKKEAQYQENLEKAKTSADWEKLQLHRLLEKTENKHANAVEELEDKHAAEVERINSDMEKRIKDLETAISSQTLSARTTLELVKGQLRSEHIEHVQKLKEKHKSDMEKQWDIFVMDKEECLERMKAECILEGQEEKEKRDKELLKDIEDLKSDLSSQESTLVSLRNEARKEKDSRIIAEKKLSELQAASEHREMAVRAEITRQAEIAQKEARDTIDHLTKKCTCLTNLFEDMRSRWQQAPGEAAQLRKALQDEKAKSAALRRQLDALSRYHRDDRGIWKEDKEHPDTSEDVKTEGSVTVKVLNTVNIEKINIVEKDKSIVHTEAEKNEIQEAEESKFIEVKPLKRKRRKVRLLSPAKTVYLPPVTVPVRIRQFDENKKKK